MWLKDMQATLDAGARIAGILPKGLFTLHLKGDLGAGKTTLVRGLLQSLGHQGNVKSPTYTLVEPYQLPARIAFHFDLYRLADPEELLYLGVEDYLSQPALLLIEWPEQGGNLLPEADLTVSLSYQNAGRLLEYQAHSAAGQAVCDNLNK